MGEILDEDELFEVLKKRINHLKTLNDN